MSRASTAESNGNLPLYDNGPVAMSRRVPELSQIISKFTDSVVCGDISELTLLVSEPKVTRTSTQMDDIIQSPALQQIRWKQLQKSNSIDNINILQHPSLLKSHGYY